MSSKRPFGPKRSTSFTLHSPLEIPKKQNCVLRMYPFTVGNQRRFIRAVHVQTKHHFLLNSISENAHPFESLVPLEVFFEQYIFSDVFEAPLPKHDCLSQTKDFLCVPYCPGLSGQGMRFFPSPVTKNKCCPQNFLPGTTWNRHGRFLCSIKN